jgi:hypothetical protein
MAPRIVSTSRVIKATPEAIFAVLSDPSKHPIIDGSGSVKQPVGDSSRLVLGSLFSMDMQMRTKYKTENVVCEYQEDRLIAWHHKANLIWRYELEPVDGGTKVTESFDYHHFLGLFIPLLGWQKKNLANMEKTLAKLDAYVRTGDPEG